MALCAIEPDRPRAPRGRDRPNTVATPRRRLPHRRTASAGGMTGADTCDKRPGAVRVSAGARGRRLWARSSLSCRLHAPSLGTGRVSRVMRNERRASRPQSQGHAARARLAAVARLKRHVRRRRGIAAGTVTRMGRDAKGGSVAWACCPRDRAGPTEAEGRVREPPTCERFERFHLIGE